MRIRIKSDELINMLIDKKRKVLLEKYNLDLEALEKIADSMKKGRWEFIS